MAIFASRMSPRLSSSRPTEFQDFVSLDATTRILLSFTPPLCAGASRNAQTH
jgi:hypothetical protein